jgi:hypothetical protein
VVQRPHAHGGIMVKNRVRIEPQVPPEVTYQESILTSARANSSGATEGFDQRCT